MGHRNNAAPKPWFAYILSCADDTLYTGVSTDVERRVGEHNAGAPLGARYTRTRRPVVLVYLESVASRSEALRRELEIKALDRAAKLTLIAAAASRE
ncbi:MAG: GIY-YIG nuclease family protein [Pseudomonadota bacterium]|nr:GIY-YIG nuclease family protein [Pseudomonadota bacterium]